ncbi:hypothetical protein ACFSUS_19150 [Spirosoma soli]|uniref:Uncharacterized protein n=1 Tax=Spirosoma soli TaxID=1770529 RepID=A0ABW5M9H6_9BACT
MSVGYRVINVDRKERIEFTEHIHMGYTFGEILGSSLFGSVLSFYMMTHLGDRISFVHDRQDEVDLFGVRYSWDELYDFTNVTEQIVEQLITSKLYEDVGIGWSDEEEGFFVRKIVQSVDIATVHVEDPNFN